MLSNSLYRKQIESSIDQSDLPWENLKNASVLVTGAAGLLGSCFVDFLLYLNEKKNYNISIFALGRNKEKLEKRFAEYLNKSYFNILAVDLSHEYNTDEKFDYILHAASNANPYMYAHYPVDTLMANVVGTNTVLKIAENSKSRKVIFVSSGEMYGQPDETTEENGFYEDYCGKVDYTSSRSCYPAGKRAAEVLCQSYALQYNIDVSIVRPCHCYGPTMDSADNRAISAFFRTVLDGNDIVLKSDGSLVRSHCYVTDAALAMFYVLFSSEKCGAYNIADRDSVCSIRKLAELISESKNKKVLFDLPTDLERLGFSKVVRAVLDPSKLEKIGWKAKVNIQDGVNSTIEILS